MNWKQYLRQLEQEEKFEEAIVFMNMIIKENPDDVDCSIFMLYFLADLVMEPHARMTNNKGIRHYWNEEYRALGKKYFHEAYIKFAHHSNEKTRCDFLYYAGITSVFGAQVFDIPEEQADMMIATAQHEQPNNPIYHLGQPGNKELAQQLLDPHSSIRRTLSTKGALGDYIVDINEPWAHLTLKGH